MQVSAQTQTLVFLTLRSAAGTSTRESSWGENENTRAKAQSASQPASKQQTQQQGLVSSARLARETAYRLAAGPCFLFPCCLCYIANTTSLAPDHSVLRILRRKLCCRPTHPSRRVDPCSHLDRPGRRRRIFLSSAMKQQLEQLPNTTPLASWQGLEWCIKERTEQISNRSGGDEWCGTEGKSCAVKMQCYCNAVIGRAAGYGCRCPQQSTLCYGACVQPHCAKPCGQITILGKDAPSPSHL